MGRLQHAETGHFNGLLETLAHTDLGETLGFPHEEPTDSQDCVCSPANPSWDAEML